MVNPSVFFSTFTYKNPKDKTDNEGYNESTHWYHNEMVSFIIIKKAGRNLCRP